MYPNVKNRWESQLKGDPTDEIFFEESDEEDTVYTKTGRESHVNEGKMCGWEDGFMQGYEESGESIFSENTGSPEEEI